MNINKLERLDNLRQSGALSEEEFQEQKRKLLADGDSYIETNAANTGSQKFGLSDSNFNVLLHLSQYCNLVVPFLGIVVPIFLWLSNKDNDPIVDQHGKNIINWSISSIIYLFGSFVLCFIFVGIFFIFIIGIIYLIFPIIGAIKADAGEVWEYPMTIKFIK